MALYHKYRPQSFDSIVGQAHIVKTLENQIKLDKVAHAYLFSGPRGIGKTTTARLLAKALNCEKRKTKDAEPCGTCNSCMEITGSRSIDVIEIDAASHTGVDNVRENIIENAQFKPTKSTYKVFIIDEVHMLSTSAFNALLKTLEEPPEHVIFILATTELHKLPETIVSRCQRFNFKKVSYEVMGKHLNSVAKSEKVKVDADVMDRIINKSDGCVRDAVSLLDQILAIGEKEITAEVASIVLPTSQAEEILLLVESLISKNIHDGLDIINKLYVEGIRFTQFSEDTIEILRVMMIMKATLQQNVSGIDLSEEVKTKIENLSKQIEYTELVRLIDLILKRRSEIQSSPLPQLPLELAIVEWCADEKEQKTRSKIEDVIEAKDDTDDKPSGNAIINELDKSEVEEKSETKTKKITEKVMEFVSKDKEPVCSVDDVEKIWQTMVSKMNAESPSLTFILKMTDIVQVLGSTVQLAVQYSFHRDKLEERRCRKQIESILSELLNKKIKIETTVAERSSEEKPDEDLNDFVTALGGEVVG